MPTGLPSEIGTYLLGQGPVGIVILVLLWVVIFLFRRLDAAQDKLIGYSAEYAKLSLATANIVQASSSSNTAMIEAVGTLKTVTEMAKQRRERT